MLTRNLPDFLVRQNKKTFIPYLSCFSYFLFSGTPNLHGPVYEGGITIQRFYQTIDSKLMEAIQWLKPTRRQIQCLSQTLCMVGGLAGLPSVLPTALFDPQYLSINEEYNKNLFARNLLDTDYLLDNGLIQVREDGGYVVRHNPKFWQSSTGPISQAHSLYSQQTKPPSITKLTEWTTMLRLIHLR